METFKTGLDRGFDICHKMLDSALKMETESFGVAVARVDIMRVERDYLVRKLQEIQHKLPHELQCLGIAEILERYEKKVVDTASTV